jgi:heterodisulfide reductase subunit B
VVGTDVLKEKVKKPLGWNIACHYGCHTVRYTDAERPDKAEHPSKMESIIIALGGRSSDYSEKLNCCGGPLMVTHRDSALTKAGEKLKAVQDRGFDALTIVCPLGGRVLDSKQEKAAGMVGEKLKMPVFYLTQLVGLSMGMEPESLGLNLNLSPAKYLLS